MRDNLSWLSEKMKRASYLVDLLHCIKCNNLQVERFTFFFYILISTPIDCNIRKLSANSKLLPPIRYEKLYVRTFLGCTHADVRPVVNGKFRNGQSVCVLARPWRIATTVALADDSALSRTPRRQSRPSIIRAATFARRQRRRRRR